MILHSLGEILGELLAGLLAVTPWVIGAAIGVALYKSQKRDFIFVGLVPLLCFLALDLYLRGVSFSGYCCDNGDGTSCAQPGLDGYVLEHVLGLEKPIYSDSYVWWPLGTFIHGSFFFIPAVVFAGAIAWSLRRRFTFGVSFALVVMCGSALVYYRQTFNVVSPPSSFKDCKPWSGYAAGR